MPILFVDIRYSMAAWDGPEARFHRAAAAALNDAKAPGQVVETLTLVRMVCSALMRAKG